eukprot:scaffold8533_cov248-Pinguiococcus_pyrenoidosus.AAC.2
MTLEAGAGCESRCQERAVLPSQNTGSCRHLPQLLTPDAAVSAGPWSRTSVGSTRSRARWSARGARGLRRALRVCPPGGPFHLPEGKKRRAHGDGEEQQRHAEDEASLAPALRREQSRREGTASHAGLGLVPGRAGAANGQNDTERDEKLANHATATRSAAPCARALPPGARLARPCCWWGQRRRGPRNPIVRSLWRQPARVARTLHFALTLRRLCYARSTAFTGNF